MPFPRPPLPLRAAGGGQRAASYAASLVVHSAAALAAIAVPFAVLRGTPDERLPARVAFVSAAPAHELARLERAAPVERTELTEPPPPEPELVPVEEPAGEERVEAPAPEERFEPLPLGEDPLARVSPRAFERRAGPAEPPPAEFPSDEPPPASPWSEATDAPAVPPAAAPPAEPTPSDPAPPEPVGQESTESAPELLPGHAREPGYPRRALRMGWQGAVVLCLTVGPNGTVTEAVVLESSGYDALDEAALEAARTWRFRPGTRDGAPAAMDVLQRFSFELER